jgi:hypothetical protein
MPALPVASLDVYRRRQCAFESFLEAGLSSSIMHSEVLLLVGRSPAADFAEVLQWTQVVALQCRSVAPSTPPSMFYDGLA